MRIPEQKSPPPMPKVKPPRKPSEKPQDPIIKKSKHPTKVGNLGYLNSIYCPRCGRLIFSYYDKDRDPDKNEGYKFYIWHEINFCARCGLWLNLDEWKNPDDTSRDINDLFDDDELDLE